MLLKKIFADGLFLLHGSILLVILFGRLFQTLWWLYVPILGITLTSEVLLGYRFLSRWEFDLRKQINPEIAYDFTFSGYYTRKLTGHSLRTELVKVAAWTFLPASLGLELYFHFLVS